MNTLAVLRLIARKARREVASTLKALKHLPRKTIAEPFDHRCLAKNRNRRACYLLEGLRRSEAQIQIKRHCKTVGIHPVPYDRYELVCEVFDAESVYMYAAGHRIWSRMAQEERAHKEQIQQAASEGTCKPMAKKHQGGGQDDDSENELGDSAAESQDNDLQFVGIKLKCEQ